MHELYKCVQYLEPACAQFNFITHSHRLNDRMYRICGALSLYSRCMKYFIQAIQFIQFIEVKAGFCCCCNGILCVRLGSIIHDYTLDTEFPSSFPSSYFFGFTFIHFVLSPLSDASLVHIMYLIARCFCCL